MKRTLAFILLLLLFAGLFGCASRIVYETTVGDETFTVDLDARTITDSEGRVYSFKLGESDSGDSVSITYPNGDVYSTWTEGSGMGFSTGELSDGVHYGDTLADAVRNRPRALYKVIAGKFVAVVVIIVGIIGISAPEAVWQLNRGWKFKEAEPSNVALIMNRVIGGFMAVVGVFLLFIL